MLKTFLMAIFSKLAKSHSKQINKAQKWIDNAQATFASAIQEAQIAEEKFDKIVEDAQQQIDKLRASTQQEIDKLEATISDSNVRKEKTVNFKNKIENFIKE
ncbi:hypothetical protein RVS70_05600 [Virgibacillus sp. M23]|uniref:hypothetical protein n=1 Tax=Virgibacillus sp. M23 TaxID=3079030 RepID=UPI002A9133AD|nr:hypothetical protein [Virgibacillus sp. M23]MDY7043675.1 hypothetical protein [Virgibacillus sp. M23]